MSPSALPVHQRVARIGLVAALLVAIPVVDSANWFEGRTRNDGVAGSLDVQLVDGETPSNTAPTNVVAARANPPASGQLIVTWNAPTAGTVVSYAVESTPAGGTCTVTGVSSDGDATSTTVASTTTAGETTTTAGETTTTAETTTTTILASEPVAASEEETTTTIPEETTTTILEETTTTAEETTTTVSETTTTVVGSSTTAEVTTTTVSSDVDPVATTCTITGLTNDTRYSFVVTATFSSGPDMASSPSEEVAPGLKPDAPTGLVATPGNGQVALSWSAPANAGGSAVTDYVIESSTNGGDAWSVVTDEVGTGVSLTVTGLTNHTVYLFRVAAANTSGTGPFSSASPSARPTATQIDTLQGFLHGQYAQVGVRANGAFGSTLTPDGFNGNSGGCLGFRSDRNKDGWGTTIDDGDFFCPGSPFEGWQVKVNGVSTANSDSSTGVAGALTDVSRAEGSQSVVWTAGAAYRDLSIRQVYSVPDTGQVLHTDVTLTNETGSAISNIYFGRGFDPDNESDSTGTESMPCTGATSIFQSCNTVAGQGADSDVRAQWTNGAFISLQSGDSRARVARQTSGFSSPDPQNIWNAGENRAATGTYLGNSGSTLADAGIYLAVYVPSLAAGSSTTFRISYVLSASEANVPTATTDDASGAGASTATLNATVNARGATTTPTFTYGRSSTLASGNTTVTLPTISGSSPEELSTALTGLLPSTTYYFRIDAASDAGSSRGAIRSFSTVSELAPVAITDPGSAVIGTATFNGTVNPKGETTTATFEYSIARDFSAGVSETDPVTLTGSTDQEVTAAVSEFTTGQTYYFRTKAVNTNGTTRGVTRSVSLAPGGSTTTTAATTPPGGSVETSSTSSSTSTSSTIAPTTTVVRPRPTTTTTRPSGSATTSPGTSATTTTAPRSTSTTLRPASASTTSPAAGGTSSTTTTTVVTRRLPAEDVRVTTVTTTTVPGASSPSTTIPGNRQRTPQEIQQALSEKKTNVDDLSLPVFVGGELPRPNPENPVVIQTEGGDQFEIVTLNEETIRMRGTSGFELDVAAADDEGTLESVSSRGAIVVEQQNYITVQGNGFQPGTDAHVWLFSEPRRLGVARISADGSFKQRFLVGKEIQPGPHTAQVNGTTSDGVVRSLNLAVEVLPTDGGAGSGLGRLLRAILISLLVILLGIAGIIFLAFLRDDDEEDEEGDDHRPRGAGHGVPARRVDGAAKTVRVVERV